MHSSVEVEMNHSFKDWLKRPMPRWRDGGWKDRAAVLGLALLLYSLAAMLYSHLAHAQAIPVKAGQPVQDAWLVECDLELAAGRCNWACFLTADDYEWISDICAVAGIAPEVLTPPQALIVGLTAKRLCKAWMTKNFNNCVARGCIPKSPVIYRWHPEDGPILVETDEAAEAWKNYAIEHPQD